MKIKTYIVAFAVLLVSACEQPQAPLIITPVKVEVVSTDQGDSSLAFSAQIVPQTNLDVAFRTDGYIVEIAKRKGVNGKQRPLQAGDKVIAGEFLASVDDSQYQDRLISAQANLNKALAAESKAKEDHLRATALKASNSITEPDFDSVKQELATASASVDGARAQRDEAKNKLAETKLTAPLAAVINQRSIELGSLVRPGSVGFSLANTDFVKAVFGIPEQVLGSVAIGDKIGIKIISMPEKTFYGSVSQVSPAASQRTRIFEVEVSIDNSEALLKQGMIAALQLPKSASSGLIVSIPMDSIVQSNDGGFAVFVTRTVDGKVRVQLTAIETGAVLGNRVSVTAGLEPGQAIVISGAAQINDGQTVRIVE